jgi:hypothetical protein
MKAIRYSVVFLALFLFVSVVSPLRALWVENGVPIVVEPGLQWLHQLASDGDGGALIVWADERSGESQKDIYIQRINSEGGVHWTVDGNVVCGADNTQWMPQLICDGSGGTIVTWCDYRDGGSDIFAQRVNADGIMTWPVDGEIVCGAIDGQYYPEIVPDGSGGAIITWEDSRMAESDIYAQRVDSLGNVEWTADGVGICAASGYQSFQKILADGSGGAVIVWQDARNGNPYNDIYAQRVDSLGNVEWAVNGVAVCALTGRHYAPEIISDCAGGAIIAWTDRRYGNYDIFVQRLDSNGSVQWTPSGVAVCTADSTQWFPQIVSDGSGGAIIAWTDRRNGDYDVYAQRIDSNGSMQWTPGGIAVCVAPEDQGNTEYGYGLSMIFSDPGGAVLAWQDLRDTYYTIYMQQIDIGGNALWASNGVTIGPSIVNRTDPRLASDLNGGVIVGWVEGDIDNTDIYAARIDPNGDPVATLLQSYCASLGDACIKVEWTLAEVDEEALFFIFRKESAAGSWDEIPDAVIECNGLYFTLEDDYLEPGMAYAYRVEVELGDDRSLLFETDPVTVPELPLTLHQNYPNPFNPSTNIKYYLPYAVDVRLAVYNVTGRLVRVLVDEHLEQGNKDTTWDGKDTHGKQVSSGVYFLRFKAGKQTEIRKMLLLR